MDAGPAPIGPRPPRSEEKAGLSSAPDAAAFTLHNASVGGLVPSREALIASLPPGVGHLRNRRWGQGFLLLAGSLFFAYVAAHPAHYAIPPPPWGLAAAGAAVLLAFWLYAARDLERSTGADTGRGRGATDPSSRPGRGSRNR